MSEPFTQFGWTFEVGGLAQVDVRRPDAEQDFVTLRITYLDPDTDSRWSVEAVMTVDKAAVLAADLGAKVRELQLQPA